MYQILLDQTNQGKRAAVLREAQPVAFFWESHTSVPHVGNIYLTRIDSLMPSLDGVFVSLSPNYKGFLPKQEWPEETNTPLSFQSLKQGDLLVLQVKREPIGNKQALMTRNIQIKGMSLIYLPFGGYIAASHELQEAVRNRLKAHPPMSMASPEGVIFRSLAGTLSNQELVKEWEALQEEWKTLKVRSTDHQQPMLLKGNSLFAEKLRLQLSRLDEREWWTNEGDEADYLRENGETIHCHPHPFETFSINHLWEDALHPTVYLKSGLSLVINHTEALTVIDVNSGNYTGGSSKEEMAFQMNLEAVKEIARQLPLRQIGGIIMIDLIKMNQEAHRRTVLHTFKDHLKKDLVTTQVTGYTPLGLLEMTRKKTHLSLSQLAAQVGAKD